jgi:hypothetical protein
MNDYHVVHGDLLLAVLDALTLGERVLRMPVGGAPESWGRVRAGVSKARPALTSLLHTLEENAPPVVRKAVQEVRAGSNGG